MTAPPLDVVALFAVLLGVPALLMADYGRRVWVFRRRRRREGIRGFEVKRCD